MALAEKPLLRLGWDHMTEVGWWDLVGLGLPPQLAELATDMSRRAGRRLRVYVMPALAAGLAGVAVPVLDEDGVLFDLSLLDHGEELANVIAHELAYMSYPGWRDGGIEEHDEMQKFVSLLAPAMLSYLPTKVADLDALAEITLCNQLAA